MGKTGRDGEVGVGRVGFVRVCMCISSSWGIVEKRQGKTLCCPGERECKDETSGQRSALGSDRSRMSTGPPTLTHTCRQYGREIVLSELLKRRIEGNKRIITLIIRITTGTDGHTREKGKFPSNIIGCLGSVM